MLNIKNDLVDISMGAGGRAMHNLIEGLMKKHFTNQFLQQGEDQAILPEMKGKLAMTTDSYVITPYFFPGGDIGSLAICGTVNDLAVGGAKPLYISVGFILEEGLPLADLEKIVISMAKTAREANVYIVTGDTKVVEKGSGDGIFINTAGVGILDDEDFISREELTEDDVIIINGNIAEHGVAVMSKRENLDFISEVKTDATCLNDLIAELKKNDCKVKTMRDPTRGGIAATLNEWANQYNVEITIDEDNLPVTTEVNSACELLGLDPLFIANEGKVLIVCKKSYCERILDVLSLHAKGKNSRVIAKITNSTRPNVLMKTSFGGLRRVDWLSGEQLPRIC